MAPPLRKALAKNAFAEQKFEAPENKAALYEGAVVDHKTARTQPSILTPAQLRAARALVGWSRETLADKSGTAAQTVQGFETLGSDPKLSTLNKWYRALEGAGFEFIGDDAKRGPGVRLRHSGKPAGKRK